MRISDWRSDVCSSDLRAALYVPFGAERFRDRIIDAVPAWMRSWLELLVADPRRDGDADIVLIIGEHTVKVRELLEERRRIMLRRVEHRTVGCVPAPREQAGTFVVVDRVLSCGITDPVAVENPIDDSRPHAAPP